MKANSCADCGTGFEVNGIEIDDLRTGQSMRVCADCFTDRLPDPDDGAPVPLETYDCPACGGVVEGTLRSTAENTGLIAECQTDECSYIHVTDARERMEMRKVNDD